MTQTSLVVILLNFLSFSVRSDTVLHLDIRRRRPTTMETLYLVLSSPYVYFILIHFSLT